MSETTSTDPRRRALLVSATAAAALAACGGGGDGGGLGIVAVPVFNSAFVGETPSDGSPVLTVTLLLKPQIPASPSGSFVDSTLVVRVRGGTTDLNRYAVTGTFSGDTFTLDVASASPPIALRYQGRFDSADVIRLVQVPLAPSAAQPTLTLRRQ